MNSCIVTLLLILLSAEAYSAYSSLCNQNVSAEFQSATIIENYTAQNEENGMEYPRSTYIKSEEGNGTTYVVRPSNVKPCLRKCCPLGKSLKNKNCTQHEQAFLVNVTKPATNETYQVDGVNHFALIIGSKCPLEDMYFLDPKQYPDDAYFINELDGILHTPLFMNNTFGVDLFCLDYDYLKEEYRIMICNDAEFIEINASRKVTGILYPILMAISLPPLLVTFFVYTLIAELRNLHGKCLVCYVLCLFCTYLSLAMGHTGKDWLPPSVCTFISFNGMFWFLGVFFWLNVIGFDICLTFSDKRPIIGTMEEQENKKFIYYSLYAWVCPTIVLSAALIMEYIPSIPSHYVKPNFGIDRCWFNDKTAVLYYFYGPASIIMISNVIMFVITVINLSKFNREMQVLKKAGAKTRDNKENRNRFILFIKLMIMLGVNWAADVTSWAIGRISYWYITDVLNCLQGVFVFLIFVWNGKTRKLIKKKLFPQTTPPETISSRKWLPENYSDPQKSTARGETAATSLNSWI